MPKRDGVVKFTLYIPEDLYNRSVAVVAKRKQTGTRSASVNKLAMRGFERELEQEEAALGLEPREIEVPKGRKSRPS